MPPDAIIEHDEAGYARFRAARRIYLETSAFNRFFENFSIPELELTRAYQRRKGVIFVTSPMLLWEIMLISDRDRADAMLMAAQALFDPVLLGTPTELAVRYFEKAYDGTDPYYDVRSNTNWGRLWPAMTRDLNRTFKYDLDELITKTRPMRAISKNFRNIIDGTPHTDDIVEAIRSYVDLVHNALADDLEASGIDRITARFVILYACLLLMVSADLESAAARDFWERRGFVGDLKHAEVTQAFFDLPHMFDHGPLLCMAMMAAFQYRSGIANRGAILDGLHLSYAPYVHTILSDDAAFLGIARTHSYFAPRLLHMSQFDLKRVELRLADYPEANLSWQ